MSAAVTKGLTFATGQTYTAGHFNDYVRGASIAGIDRSTIDQSLGSLLTRGVAEPAMPYSKEVRIDSTGSDLPAANVTIGSALKFVGADPSVYRPFFNSGNGSAVEGSGLQSSVSGSSGGEAYAGLYAETVGLNNASYDVVGVATEPNASNMVYAFLSGICKVRVTGTVARGDWLTFANSGTNGVAKTSNTNRDTGSTSILSQSIMALETHSGSTPALILCKVFK